MYEILALDLPHTIPLTQISVTLKELGLDNPSGYHIEDLYDDHVYGIVTPDRRFKVDVNPSGSKYCCVPARQHWPLKVSMKFCVNFHNIWRRPLPGKDFKDF